MKKAMSKSRLFVALLLSFILVVVGCSSGTGTPSNNVADNGKQPVTLKFTFWGSTYEKKAMDNAVKTFQEKHNNIKIDAQHIPADYDTKLTAMVAGNEAPDLGYVRDLMALPWAEEGKLYNILEFIDKDSTLKKDEFLDHAFIDWAPGKSFGMFTAKEAYGLFYNKDMLKAAGVADLPTKAEQAFSWDQFVEVARKLTIDHNGKNALDPAFDKTKIKQYGISFDPTYTGYMQMVFSAGGDYISEDGKSFGLTKPESIDAIQKMADLIHKYHVAPSPVEAKSIPAGAASLQSKQVAILLTGQWVLLDLAQSGMNFGIGILPKIKMNATATSTGTMSIFKSTKHPEEAYTFWKYLNNPESALELHANGLWMPLMKKWYTEPALVAKWADVKPAHPEGYKEAIMEPSLNHTHKLPSAYVKNFAKINALVQPAIERTYLGQTTAEQALKGIEAEVSKLIMGRYN
ncbi:ABC transporter substrate-binding protein [Paenibacillus agricola]|uniref:Sugar ABC transporter substrate-binding protein n=1 Tax=Paenibacillus agricola TaxID=2716264 RepID=A0ABX0J739_9BACL|nr:sugar ABC transporter substrate-binding protein [Paenibacillus agricola]NHN32174.1 sugar ABC transporter substrate-binding protein [Paenibacillus agricola]